MNDYPSIIDLLKDTAERMSDRPAILLPDRSVSFSAFDQLSDRVAAFLASQGIAKGDRVGLYCINSDAFALAYFGIVKAGAAVVPINLLLTAREVTYILKDAGAKALIYFDAFAANALAAADELPGIDFTLRIGGEPTRDREFGWPAAVGCDAPCPRIEIEPAEDLVAIIYTSGTTGFPKGAMLTHRNLASNTWSIREALKLTPGEDIFVTVLPMFHAFAATVGMLFPLLHGCAFAPLPKFDPALVADTIERTGATMFAAVPSMYSVLMRLPDEAVAKFASLRYCISGGAAMPVELMKQFEDKFGKLIYEGDGPTECSPVTCVNPIGGVRKYASVGLPVSRVDMEIRDDHGVELPRGQIGEICVKGPNVMKGYWNRPEETAEVFFGEWLRTGDLGYEDEEGYFFIVDRKKDMLIVNGMNVYPRVVEEVLYQHPAVHEAAVVGQRSELHGEVPIAYVSLKPDSTATEKDLRAHCIQNLGRYQVPKKFHVIPQLPKNAAGKILKRELRKDGETERGVV